MTTSTPNQRLQQKIQVIKNRILQGRYVAFYLSYDLEGSDADSTRTNITDALKNLKDAEYIKIGTRNDIDQTSGIISSENISLSKTSIRQIIKQNTQSTQSALIRLVIIALLDGDWIIAN